MPDSLYEDTSLGRVEKRWFALWQHMAKLHAAKNADYGQTNEDPYANFHGSTRLGIDPWRGALVRMMDKIRRLESYAQRGSLEVSDESFEDTLMDLAVYSLICIVLHRENHA